MPFKNPFKKDEESQEYEVEDVIEFEEYEEDNEKYEEESINYQAGSQKISVENAEDILITDIFNALEIPSAAELDEHYRLGRFEEPDANELLKRAGIDFTEIAEHFLDFVGIPIPRKEATKHFLICGSTGSGKTTLIKVLIARALNDIGKKRNTRAIIYDPKRDLASFLFGYYKNEYDLKTAKKIIKILNPFDTRCVAWNLAKDIRTKSEAKTFASIVIPDIDSNNPFFAKAARLILTDLIYSFILTSKKIQKENESKKNDDLKTPELEWTLRDICAAFHPILYSAFDSELKFTDKNSLVNFQVAEAILDKHPLTQRTIAFINRGNEKGSNNDVLLTLLNYLDELEAVAAAWDQRPETISFREWVKDEDGQILILGSSAENEEAISAVNSAMVQFIGALINDGKDTEQNVYPKPSDEGRPSYKVAPKYPMQTSVRKYPSRTWIFLDEFADLKIKNLERFLTKGRSKGVCAVLSFQDYASIKDSYDENIASVIASCCNFKIFLQSDGEAAEWVVRMVGKQRFYESSYGTQESGAYMEGDSYAKTRGGNSSTTETKSYSFTKTNGSSVNIAVVERDLVMPGDIANLKNPNGFEGIVKCSQLGGKFWKFTYDWSDINEIINISSKEPNFSSRIEEEGTDFLDLRLFDKGNSLKLDDFMRFDIDYEEFNRKRRKREQNVNDDKLRGFIEIVKWRGYMTSDEKLDYLSLTEAEKQTFDRYVTKQVDEEDLTKDEADLFEIFGVKEKRD